MEEENRELKKEKIKKQTRIAQIIIAILLIATFLTDLFVCIYVDSFTVGYFFFVIFIAFMPLATTITCLEAAFIRDVSKEEQKNAIINLVKFLSFQILESFFILSALQKWTVAFYLIGCIVLIIKIASIISNFTGNYIFGKSTLLLDLLVILGIVILLIASIPEEYQYIQSIITTIVAAVMGGLITLTGVVLTIKHGDKQQEEDKKQLELDRKAEEKKKAKPYFTFNMLACEPDKSIGTKTCISDSDINYKCELVAELENSNFAPFILKKVFHDDKSFEMVGNTVVLQNGKVLVSWLFDKFLDNYLEIEDLLGNKYYYLIKMITFNKLSNENKYCYTIREISEVPKEDLINKGILQ